MGRTGGRYPGPVRASARAGDGQPIVVTGIKRQDVVDWGRPPAAEEHQAVVLAGASPDEDVPHPRAGQVRPRHSYPGRPAEAGDNEGGERCPIPTVEPLHPRTAAGP